MAVSSTTATVYISRRQNFQSSPTCSSTIPAKSVPFRSKPRKYHTVRSSTGDSPAAAEATTTATESETPIELPQGPPSLINSLNVERALRGIPITDVDHYGRLGLRFRCTNDQVYEAYAKKVEELKNEGSITEDELNEKLEFLKESFRILSSADERRFYDWSLARSRKPEEYVWPFEVDESKKSTETPPPAQEPENVEPTRYVGYFFLGWLVLAFVLSIAFNR